ncbi:MAG: hypothetical protein DYG98_07690 [Haliscomenobacteraceae bacterium CHB4]|nr:hypothetical protein [Haliscomenobacteraceae bacterium CHB4]
MCVIDAVSPFGAAFLFHQIVLNFSGNRTQKRLFSEILNILLIFKLLFENFDLILHNVLFLSNNFFFDKTWFFKKIKIAANRFNPENNLI